jgi:hypothetical protein
MAILPKLIFNKKSDEGFLIIVFPDNQEELEAPYSIHREDTFFIVKGINNEQKVTYVIPDSIECYFEMRSDEIDDEEDAEIELEK